MNRIEVMSGTSKMFPLISFHCIVDDDFGLLKLVYEQYLRTDVFKVSDKNDIDTIDMLYHRSDKNPLYLIANDYIDRSLLDSYYDEFKEKKEYDIYQHSITTNVLNMISMFVVTPGIVPTILCYSREQMDIIKNEETLSDIPIIIYNENIDMNMYTQFFLKDLDELERFSNLKLKSFYISTCKINFDENNELKISDNLYNSILRNHNSISIFDMYMKDMFKGDK